MKNQIITLSRFKENVNYQVPAWGYRTVFPLLHICEYKTRTAVHHESIINIEYNYGEQKKKNVNWEGSNVRCAECSGHWLGNAGNK